MEKEYVEIVDAIEYSLHEGAHGYGGILLHVNTKDSIFTTSHNGVVYLDKNIAHDLGLLPTIKKEMSIEKYLDKLKGHKFQIRAHLKEELKNSIAFARKEYIHRAHDAIEHFMPLIIAAEAQHLEEGLMLMIQDVFAGDADKPGDMWDKFSHPWVDVFFDKNEGEKSFVGRLAFKLRELTTKNPKMKLDDGQHLHEVMRFNAGIDILAKLIEEMFRRELGKELVIERPYLLAASRRLGNYKEHHITKLNFPAWTGSEKNVNVSPGKIAVHGFLNDEGHLHVMEHKEK